MRRYFSNREINFSASGLAKQLIKEYYWNIFSENYVTRLWDNWVKFHSKDNLKNGIILWVPSYLWSFPIFFSCDTVEWKRFSCYMVNVSFESCKHCWMSYRDRL